MQSKDTGDHRHASLKSPLGDLLGLGNKDPGEYRHAPVSAAKTTWPLTLYERICSENRVE